MELTNKGRRGVLFGANVLGLLVMLLGQLNGGGIAAALVVVAVFGYFLVAKGSDSLPATGQVITLVFMDLCAYVALNYQVVLDGFAAEGISLALENIGGEFAIFMVAALVAALIGFTSVPWFLGVAGGLLGFAVILGAYGGGTLDHIEFVGNGRTIAAIFLVSAVFWTVCLYLAWKTRAPGKKKPDTAMVLTTVGVLVLSLVLAVGCPAFADPFVPALAQKVVQLPAEAFAWWRVLVCCVALVAMAYAFAYVPGGEPAWGTDSVVLLAWAVMVLGVRVLMDNYFPFSAALMLCLVVGACRCVGNVVAGKRTLKLPPELFLPLLLVVFILVASMLSQGLVPSAVVTLAVVLVAYVQLNGSSGKLDPADGKLWIYVVVALVAWAVAWLGKRYNALDSYLMLGMVLVFGVATLCILNQKHPGESRLPRYLSVAVCVLVALLCWLSLRTTVQVGMEPATDDATVSITSLREDNPVTAATYEWKHAFGNTIAGPAGLAEGDTVLPIQSDHLVVRVTDTAGATETYDYYFAPWMHNFEGAQQRVAEAAAAEAAAAAAEQPA